MPDFHPQTTLGRPLRILLVEDNEADVKIALRAFQKSKWQSQVFVVNDGQECLDYLNRLSKYQDKSQYPWPDLILLDISMPKMNGFGVLQQIKGGVQTSSIPVVILTGSKNAGDVQNAYAYGANSFMQKPVSYEEFCELIDHFSYYWQVLCLLPQE